MSTNQSTTADAPSLIFRSCPPDAPSDDSEVIEIRVGGASDNFHLLFALASESVGDSMLVSEPSYVSSTWTAVDIRLAASASSSGPSSEVDVSDNGLTCEEPEVEPESELDWEERVEAGLGIRFLSVGASCI